MNSRSLPSYKIIIFFITCVVSLSLTNSVIAQNNNVAENVSEKTEKFLGFIPLSWKEKVESWFSDVDLWRIQKAEKLDENIKTTKQDIQELNTVPLEGELVESDPNKREVKNIFLNLKLLGYQIAYFVFYYQIAFYVTGFLIIFLTLRALYRAVRRPQWE